MVIRKGVIHRKAAMQRSRLQYGRVRMSTYRTLPLRLRPRFSGSSWPNDEAMDDLLPLLDSFPDAPGCAASSERRTGSGELARDAPPLRAGSSPHADVARSVETWT